MGLKKDNKSYSAEAIYLEMCEGEKAPFGYSVMLSYVMCTLVHLCIPFHTRFGLLTRCLKAGDSTVEGFKNV